MFGLLDSKQKKYLDLFQIFFFSFYPGKLTVRQFYPGKLTVRQFYPGKLTVRQFYPGKLTVHQFYPGKLGGFVSLVSAVSVARPTSGVLYSSVLGSIKQEKLAARDFNGMLRNPVQREDFSCFMRMIPPGRPERRRQGTSLCFRWRGKLKGVMYD